MQQSIPSFSTLAELFYNTVSVYEHNKDKFAYMRKINDTYHGITFAEVRDMVEKFAVGLLDLGIKKGDRVGIISENRLEWIIADLACAVTGIIDVPVFPTLTAKQCEYVFNNCSASAIIVSNSFQLGKILAHQHELSHIRHIITMNDDAKGNHPFVKSMNDIMIHGEKIADMQSRRRLMQEQAAAIRADDIMTLIYTSGTTGHPKGVVLTHGNIASNVMSCTGCYTITSDDTMLSYLPLCHSYERVAGYLLPLAKGATVAFAESIEKVAANINEVRPTLMTSVPRLFERIQTRIVHQMAKEKPAKQKIFAWALQVGTIWIRNKMAGKSSLINSMQYKIADALVFSKIRERMGGKIRTFVSGGAALKNDTAEFFLMQGLTILEGYGLTEASPVLTVNRPDSIEIGTVGKPLPNVEIRLSAEGEIQARGANIMRGYWNDEQATKETMTDDGWLKTGDVGIWTQNGNLKITDRIKHLFVSSGGKNIAPTPIENLICHSALIEQCVLIGENRPYCTALIAPNSDELMHYAEKQGIVFNTVEELVQKPEIIRLFHRDIDHWQKDLAKYERIRKFTILPRLLTVEDGELTPKMSIKRKVVEEKYRETIEKMYANSDIGE